MLYPIVILRLAVIIYVKSIFEVNASFCPDTILWPYLGPYSVLALDSLQQLG